MDSYVVIVLFAVLGIALVCSIYLANWALRPDLPSESNQSVYECGQDAAMTTSYMEFNLRYYVYALLFVIFDVEVVFFFPLATVLRTSGVLCFIELLAFSAILAIGLAYAWKKGALVWD